MHLHIYTHMDTHRNVVYQGKLDDFDAALDSLPKGAAPAAPAAARVELPAFAAEWALPQQGVLELDFIWTHTTPPYRPRDATKPIPDEQLHALTRDIKLTTRRVLAQKPLDLPSCFSAGALRPVTQMLARLPVSARQAVAVCEAAVVVDQV